MVASSRALPACVHLQNSRGSSADHSIVEAHPQSTVLRAGLLTGAADSSSVVAAQALRDAVVAGIAGGRGASGLHAPGAYVRVTIEYARRPAVLVPISGAG